MVLTHAEVEACLSKDWPSKGWINEYAEKENQIATQLYPSFRKLRHSDGRSEDVLPIDLYDASSGVAVEIKYKKAGTDKNGLYVQQSKLDAAKDLRSLGAQAVMLVYFQHIMVRNGAENIETLVKREINLYDILDGKTPKLVPNAMGVDSEWAVPIEYWSKGQAVMLNV